MLRMPLKTVIMEISRGKDGKIRGTPPTQSAVASFQGRPPLESWLGLPQATADRHKELLLGILSSCGEDDIDLVTRQHEIEKIKPRPTPHVGGVTSCVAPTVLPILTERRTKINTVQRANHTTQPHPKKRKVVMSLSIIELETLVLSNALHLSPDVEFAASMESLAVTKAKQRTSKKDATAETVSILYNECSVTALSRWAAGAHAIKTSSVEGDWLVPTTSSNFHLCSICDRFGHFEVECKSIDSETLLQRIAPEIRKQRSLALLIGKEKQQKVSVRSEPEEGSSGIDPNEKIAVSISLLANQPQLSPEENVPPRNAGTSSLGQKKFEQGSSPRGLPSPRHPEGESAVCKVCQTSFCGDDILLCDGCDAPHHYQCLEPPLEGVPLGNWFCVACSRYDSDVSSVDDLEPCEGFVIEQRRVSAASNTIRNTTLGFNGGCGTTSLSMSKYQPYSEGQWSERLIEVDKDSSDFNFTEMVASQRPNGWQTAETEEQDEMVILSRPLDHGKKSFASSKSLWDPFQEAIAERIDEGAGKSCTNVTLLNDETGVDNLIGSLVSWYVKDSNANEDDSSNDTMLVGDVISTDRTNLYALVRIMHDFDRSALSLKQSIEKSISSNSRSIAQCQSAITSISIGSSVWVPLKDLRIIHRPPHGLTRENASTGLEHALRAELRKRKNGMGSYISKETVATTTATEAALFTEAEETGVYQAERILDERMVKVRGVALKQYLIKWKGFSLAESTWEPEKNILSQNLVRIFHVEQLINKLSESPEAHDCSSITSRVVESLEEGKNRLRLAETAGNKGSKAMGRVCPFCQNWFRATSGLFSHIRIHESEPNFKDIREACRLGFDQIYSAETSIPPPLR